MITSLLPIPDFSQACLSFPLHLFFFFLVLSSIRRLKGWKKEGGEVWKKEPTK